MKFQMKEVGFHADLPYGRLDIAGDEAHGFRPYQLLVSSVAVCSGGVLRSIFKKMRLDVENIEIEAEVERNEAVANRLEKIALHFKITGADLTDEKVGKALKLARKNCAMVQSVAGSIEVVETFELV